MRQTSEQIYKYVNKDKFSPGNLRVMKTIFFTWTEDNSISVIQHLQYVKKLVLFISNKIVKKINKKQYATQQKTSNISQNYDKSIVKQIWNTSTVSIEQSCTQTETKNNEYLNPEIFEQRSFRTMKIETLLIKPEQTT